LFLRTAPSPKPRSGSLLATGDKISILKENKEQEKNIKNKADSATAPINDLENINTETGSEIFETEEGSAQNDTDNRVEKVNDATEETSAENITDRIEKVDDASMEQQKIEKPRHSVSIDKDVSDKSKKKIKIADAKGKKADDTCAKQETEKQKHLDQDVFDKSKKKKNIKKKPADESSEDV